MIFTRHLKTMQSAFAGIALLLVGGCGGGGLLADGGIIGTGSIIGTVPGTIIEAYGDQGQYFRTLSEDNGTDQHPFLLGLPAGVGFQLVMIINEDSDDEIIIPIAFPGNKEGEILARITLNDGDLVDLGNIPLFRNRGEIPPSIDPDDDGILDAPFVLNEGQGSRNPLKQLDADNDGIDDYEDDDHGGSTAIHPQDKDNDGVPNYYDDDFNPGDNDEDADGIDDSEDENPGNIPEEIAHLNWNGQGMHPAGQAWREQHGDFAENNLNTCVSCHGADFMGTPLSAQVGCYDCHTGPNPEDDETGSGTENTGQQWNGQGMHPAGQAWREQHGDYAEDNLNRCASCHGADFMGTAFSGQVGCYDCHNGPNPEDD